MKYKNIVLIGMPGAGKSTLGVLLAKSLKMNFIDTDLEIQNNENQALQDIIKNQGLVEFLKVEEKTVLSLEPVNSIVATGGSVIYSEKALQHLKKTSIFVYIKLDYYTIKKRIKNISTRGIVMESGQELSDVFNERVPLYEKAADIIVNCGRNSVEKSVAEIIKVVSKYYLGSAKNN